MAQLHNMHSVVRLSSETLKRLISQASPRFAKLTLFGTVWEDHELPSWAIVCPCPTIHVNTAAVHNSSAVSLLLLLVVRVTYVPASAAKRKRSAFSDGHGKGTKGRPFLLTCAPLAAL